MRVRGLLLVVRGIDFLMSRLHHITSSVWRKWYLEPPILKHAARCRGVGGELLQDDWRVESELLEEREIPNIELDPHVA